jgi:hypothetical protein
VKFSLSSRATWPSWPLIITVLAIYLGWNGTLALIPLRFGTVDVFEQPELANLNRVFIAGATVVWFLLRLFRFHPALNTAYARCLETLPWTPGMPLPAGPLHPVVQDVVVLAGLTILGLWPSGIAPWLVLSIACGCYLFACTALLLRMKAIDHFYGAGFVWAAFLLPEQVSWQRAGLLAVLVFILWRGNLAGFRRFPWPGIKPIEFTNNPAQINIEIFSPGVHRLRELGWPYAALSPQLKSPEVSCKRTVQAALLPGWTYFCIATNIQYEPASLLIVIFATFAALTRAGIYLNGCSPSFNIAGRLATGRLIIPGYDKILVPSGFAVLLAFLGAWIIKLSGDFHRIVEAVLIIAIMAILLGAGPRLQTWRLTGMHRFARTNPRTGQNVPLKEV